MSDVGKWLDSIGLSQYADAFLEGHIDWEVLPQLDHEVLKELGVGSPGHRLRILKAVSSLAEPPRVEPPSTAAPAADAVGPSPPTPLDGSGRRSRVPDQAAWERQPGELRPVTMLFADVVGSTAMTERLDAEDAHELLYGATQRMCEAVERHRGTVCRFMGDGIMAMFGAPVASEHHALEACEAALAMHHAVEAYGDGKNVSIRVGLHSGEVVVLRVGDGEQVEYDASGPTVPIAARLEQSAEAGQVYISAATRSLAGARIESEALAPISVKGITSPLRVFALRRIRSLDEAAPRHSTRFVGRRAELNQFTAILSTCIEEERGRTVYVRGEAGIGKTRLVEEFLRVASESGARTQRGLVLEFGTGRDAVRTLVRGFLEISLGSSKRDRREAARNALAKGLLNEDEQVYLNDLLDLPQPLELRSLYDAMDNDARNRGKHELVTALVIRLTSNAPLVIVVEDVHWADAVVLSHLASLARTVARCAALLVITSRVAGDPLGQSWRTQTANAPLTGIDLGPLQEAESMMLIEEFLSADDPLAAGCLERAAGNPLFLEQLLRNAEEGSESTLPESIQSLILARADRLNPDDREALQVAAVIGQRFELDCLRKLLDAPVYDIQPLVDQNLVRADGEAYLFAHALIQEGIYGALLRPVKMRLHAMIADWFSERDLVLHAQHLERASDPTASAAYLAAARFQVMAYRTIQALMLTEHGLEIAESRSDQFGLSQLKGELLLDLGNLNDAKRAFEYALDFGQDDRERCQALIGLASVGRATQANEATLDALERAQALAQPEHHPLELAKIHHIRGNLLFFTGNAERCGTEHEQALKFARQAGSVELEAKALSGLGDSAFSKGEMGRAREQWTRCVDMAREHGLGRIEVPNVGMLADAAYMETDLSAAATLLAEAIALATKTQDARTECFLRWSLGYVLAEQADWAESRHQAGLGLELARQIGAKQFEVVALIHVALAEQALGDGTSAEEHAGKAVSIVGEIGSGFAGAWAQGVLARVSYSADNTRTALLAGEQMLSGDCFFFSYLHFCRHAIEACLSQEWWPKVDHYCGVLQEFSVSRPTPFASFFVARGRALSALATRGPTSSTLDELERLRDSATTLGLRDALPRLECALTMQ